MTKSTLYFFAFICVITGCRKTPDFGQLSDQFIVSTSLDKNATFNSYKTYFISDTVIYIGGIASDSILVGPDALQLVGAVKDNLNSRGYTFVGRDNNPDIGLILSAIKDINVVIEYYPGWWDGYYGGCYWYYYCYPYYYPWSTVYTYTTGTVILNMYDLKNANAEGQLKGIWNTTALGALGSTATQNIGLGVDAIDQGFEQSPYLQTN